MIPSQPQVPWHHVVGNRRQFLKMSGASALAIGAATGIVSCGNGFSSTFSSIGQALDSLFGPDWLQKLAIAIAAQEIVDILKGGLEGGAWDAWSAGVESLLEDVLIGALALDSEVVAGDLAEMPRLLPPRIGRQRRFIPGGVGWADQVPPVVMAQVSQARQGDPKTDLLVACVDTGKTAVIFQPREWQTLALYVDDLTKNRTGTELDKARTLCLRRLIPSGTIPHTGPSGTLTYQARDGTVEVALTQDPEGRPVGTITASTPLESGPPLRKSFTLPTS
jgi:hypothetical protein